MEAWTNVCRRRGTSASVSVSATIKIVAILLAISFP